jgi:hypothetical protein
VIHEGEDEVAVSRHLDYLCFIQHMGPFLEEQFEETVRSRTDIFPRESRRNPW